MLNLKKKDYLVYSIIITAALVITYFYFLQVENPFYDLRVDLHNQIISKEADSAVRYRIFVPFLSQFGISILSQFLPYKFSFILSYVFYDFTVIFFTFVFLYVYLRKWFSKELSLIGILLVCLSMIVALRRHYYQPWSLLEILIFVLALLFIREKKLIPLGLLMVVGTLNRETALLIPFVFLFCNIEYKNLKQSLKKNILPFLSYIFIYLILTFAVRGFMGEAERPYGPKELWTFNLAPINLLLSSTNLFLFLGFFWIFVFLGYRYAPLFVRKTTILVFLAIPIIMLAGGWDEVRLFMLLYPVLIPLGLSYFERKEKTNLNKTIPILVFIFFIVSSFLVFNFYFSLNKPLEISGSYNANMENNGKAKHIFNQELKNIKYLKFMVNEKEFTILDASPIELHNSLQLNEFLESPTESDFVNIEDYYGTVQDFNITIVKDNKKEIISIKIRIGKKPSRSKDLQVLNTSRGSA